MTQRSAGKGLSRQFCSKHIQRAAWRGTLVGEAVRAYELRPYRQSAKRWLRRHADTADVRNLIRGTRFAIHDQGIPPSSMTWGPHLPTVTKARLVFGRLAEAGVTPEDVLEVTLAVLSLMRVRGVFYPEYIHVQVARALMRKHGVDRRGAHVRSTGKVLRLVGKQASSLTSIFASSSCLDQIAEGAAQWLASAERSERRRKEKVAANRHKREGLARRIMQARAFGAGPEDIRRLEADLRRRYGLPAQ